jgi:DNA-binding NarL/FixJ family response regulator
MPEISPSLALADQQPLFRQALAGVLVDAGWKNTLEVKTGEELLTILDVHHIDILIIDLLFGDLDIVSLCHALTGRHTHIKVLLLAAYEREAQSHQMAALRAGAVGCLSKEHGADLYIEALQLIARGMVLFQRDIIQAAFRQQHELIAPTTSTNGAVRNLRLSNLTDREHEILRLIAEGHSNTDIARILNITENTVMKHVSHIMAKLKVRNRTEAAFIYLSSGESSQ